MKRRTALQLTAALLAALAVGLLVASFDAGAQPAKMARVGYLNPSSPHPGGPIEAFRERLRELGWVEGRNLVVEYRWSEGKSERLPEFAAEFVRLGVDVIVAVNTTAAVAAKQATRSIPIVVLAVTDPVSDGLVSSLARPGGNVTGLSIMSPEIIAKNLSLLREVIPTTTEVAAIVNPVTASAPRMVKDLEAAARSLGLKLQLLEARSPGDFDEVFAAISPRAGGLFILGDGMFYMYRRELAQLALKRRLPAVYMVRQHVEAGGLMSYQTSFADLWRRAAVYVDKILRGAKPGDLPIEQPTTFELVINLKTAKALGLTIPQALLIRADALIE
jgi:putative ABC transport system substrate-binding protein